MERKAKIGPTLFDLHYRLTTKGSDEKTYPLRLADLIVFDVDPQVFPEKVIWANKDPHRQLPSWGMPGDVVYQPMHIAEKYQPYVQTILFVDPSGRGADETGVCVASYVNGYIVIHELTGFAGGYDEGTLKKIAKMALEYGVKLIKYEGNFGDAMFGSLLAPIVREICGYGVAIEDYTSKGMKETRILNLLEPAFAQHRVVFNTRAIKEKETQLQITRLQRKRGCLKHDDRVDVLWAAVKQWEDYLNFSVDSLIAKNQDKAHQDMIKSWKDDKRRALTILEDRCSGAVEVFGDGRMAVRPKKSTFVNRRKTWGGSK
jgi:hypothetical protein